MTTRLRQTTMIRGGGDDDDDDDDSAQNLPVQVSVGDNAFNPFSAWVTVASDLEVSAVVEYGEGGSFDLATPEETVAAGVDAEILVLGLRADREYQLRVVASDGVDSWTSESLTHVTAPLDEGWPQCPVEFHVAEAEFGSEEALCLPGRKGDADYMYFCIDRWGETVYALRHPEGRQLPMLRAMSTGDWATVPMDGSELLLFDHKGELFQQWPPFFFDDLTRFEHRWIDFHDVVELVEGPWAGALALASICEDTVQGAVLPGGGIIVFDVQSEQVLWDWCPHGEFGDEQPIDPLLSYDYDALDVTTGWMHVNALVHGLDPDESQFFWLSVRSQDWVIKVDVDTDAVVWRLGYGGEFELVEDLDDGNSPELPAADWFYHQHSPERIEVDGSRTRFLIFDNGNLRADENGGILAGEPYSRVVEYEIDEQTLRASVRFDHGDHIYGSPGHFYGDSNGDANMLPSGDAVVFSVGGMGEVNFVAEVSYPEAEERWRYQCEAAVEERAALYRSEYYPSLYDFTWGLRPPPPPGLTSSGTSGHASPGRIPRPRRPGG